MNRILAIFLTALLLTIGVFNLSYSAIIASNFSEADVLNGNIVKLSDYKGKFVLLNFWASWSPHCINETNALAKLYAKYSNDFVFIGASLDDNTNTVKSFFANNKPNYPMIMATEKISNAYGGIMNVPVTFFIDKEGNIIYSYTGTMSYEYLEYMIGRFIARKVRYIDNALKVNIKVKNVSLLSEASSAMAAASSSSSAAAETPKYTASNFIEKDIGSGNLVKLSDYQGKYVMLLFWVSWHSFSKTRAILTLPTLYAKYSNDFVFIGASFDTNSQIVKDLYKRFKLKYPMIMATESMIKAYGGLRFSPTIFIIDKEGNIISSFVGEKNRKTTLEMIISNCIEGDFKYDHMPTYISRSNVDMNSTISTLMFDEYTVFQQKMLEEVNFARTDPKGYAEERLKFYYNENTDNGAYKDLMGRNPVGKLTLNKKLCDTADKYAKFLAAKNVLEHYEDGNPSSRAKREGYLYGVGENLAGNSIIDAEKYPEDAVIAFVRNLIIDKGVPNLGHRYNIINKKYLELGVGLGYNPKSKLVYYTVQNFGLGR